MCCCSTSRQTISISQGIEWLESLLAGASFACVVVSHDRYFLEGIATEMAN
jgi:ATPase subunit of ABC transporter with duplicated ATPase domains